MEEKNIALFENDTVYTKENYLKFNQFHIRKRRMVPAVISYILLAFIFVVGIMLLLLGESIALAIVYLVFAVITTLYYIYLPNLAVNRILKTDKTFENTKNHYWFYRDHVAVENKYGDTKIKYDQLYRIYETSQFYYLYLNSRQAFLVEKNNSANQEQLTKLLQEQLGKNYIVKK